MGDGLPCLGLGWWIRSCDSGRVDAVEMGFSYGESWIGLGVTESRVRGRWCVRSGIEKVT